MGAEMLASLPFRAVLVDSATAPARSIEGCGFRRFLPFVTQSGLLNSRVSHRGPGWALAGALVSGAVFLDADAEQVREIGRVGVGQSDVGAFDAAQRGGGDLRRGGQLGLGQSLDDAPVAGVALVGGDGDDLLDRGVEDPHDAGQEVDLRGAFAGFPCMHGRLSHVGEPGKVGDADLALASGIGEGLRIESAQHTTCHAGTAARFIVRQIHGGLQHPVNAAVIARCRKLEYGVGGNGMMRRDSVKLPRVLSQRPTPRMPELAGFEPRFDPIPATPAAQLDEAFRPLYWWAKDLRDRADILQGLRFDAPQMTATVTVRLGSHRVITAARRHDDKPRLPHDLPTLLAEAVWRLGALGWACDLGAVRDVLRAAGLLAPPRPVQPCTALLPG